MLESKESEEKCCWEGEESGEWWKRKVDAGEEGGEWGSGVGEERKESGGVVLVRGERRVGEWCW